MASRSKRMRRYWQRKKVGSSYIQTDVGRKLNNPTTQAHGEWDKWATCGASMWHSNHKLPWEPTQTTALDAVLNQLSVRMFGHTCVIIVHLTVCHLSFQGDISGYTGQMMGLGVLMSDTGRISVFSTLLALDRGTGAVEPQLASSCVQGCGSVPLVFSVM